MRRFSDKFTPHKEQTKKMTPFRLRTISVYNPFDEREINCIGHNELRAASLPRRAEDM
jgi:hypothetical protein